MSNSKSPQILPLIPLSFPSVLDTIPRLNLSETFSIDTQKNPQQTNQQTSDSKCNWIVRFAVINYIITGCSIPGYYGYNCSTPCPEHCLSSCHIETGACLGCAPGYLGHRCESGILYPICFLITCSIDFISSLFFQLTNILKNIFLFVYFRLPIWVFWTELCHGM